MIDDMTGGGYPVYRMVQGSESDRAQVFYLAGEDEPEKVSLNGMYIKSPERTYYGRNESRSSVENGVIKPFVTPAPMPAS